MKSKEEILIEIKDIILSEFDKEESGFAYRAASKIFTEFESYAEQERKRAGFEWVSMKDRKPTEQDYVNYGRIWVYDGKNVYVKKEFREMSSKVTHWRKMDGVPAPHATTNHLRNH